MKKNETLGVFWVLVVSLAALVAGGCSTGSFVISKDNVSFFLGNPDKGLYRMLCESGDLKAVLADTQLSEKTKDYFYESNCAPAGPSKEKIAGVYSSMTPEQKEDLRFAFNKHGYMINFVPCD